MKANTTSHKDSPAGCGNTIVTAALKAQLTMAISGAVLLLCFCGIAASMDDPDSVLKPLSLCALFLSAFCGGFYASRTSGVGFPAGLLSGGIFALLVLLVSAIAVTEREFALTHTLLSVLSILLSASAGGIAGRRKKGGKGRKGKKHPGRRR